MQEKLKQSLGLSDMGLHGLVSGGKSHRLRAEVIGDWQRLVNDANKAGFEPIIVSSYRDFERQAAIWSGKAMGQRKVLDDNDNCVDLSCLSDRQKIQAIMRFSALPGTSRHHWGTDFDIAECACLPEGFQLELTVSETEGVLAPFYDWLDAYLALPQSRFFRPYASDAGGVSIEPWHLSHRSEAATFEACADKSTLKAFYYDLANKRCVEAQACLGRLNLSELPLIEAVMDNFDRLYDQFIFAD